ncbi:MAG: hypothetical protein ACRC7N_11405 [Clostridium sp.]
MKKLLMCIIMIIFIMPCDFVRGEEYEKQEGSISVSVRKDQITYFETLTNLRRITDEKIVKFIYLDKEESINIESFKILMDGKTISLTEDNIDGNYYDTKRVEDGVYFNLHINEYYNIDTIMMEYKKGINPVKGKDLTYIKEVGYDNNKNSIKLEKIKLNLWTEAGQTSLWKKNSGEDNIYSKNGSVVIEDTIGKNDKIEYAIGYSNDLNWFSNIVSTDKEYAEEFNREYGENILGGRLEEVVEDLNYDEEINIAAVSALVFGGIFIIFVIVTIVMKVKNMNNINNLSRVNILKKLPSEVDVKNVAILFNCSKYRVVALSLIEAIDYGIFDVTNNGLVINTLEDSQKITNLYEALKKYSNDSFIMYKDLERFFKSNDINNIYEEIKLRYIEPVNINELRGFKKYMMTCGENDLEKHKLFELILMAKYFIAFNIKEHGQEVYNLLNPNTLKGINLFKNILVNVNGKYFYDYLIEDIVEECEKI